MARMVATKAALSIRVDALSDAESRSDPQAAEVGITNRVKLESRLRALEHQAGIQSVRRVTAGSGRPTQKFEMSAGVGSYNTATDSVKLESVQGLLPTQPQPALQKAVGAVLEVKEEKRIKKEKKEKRKSEGAMDVDDAVAEETETKEERRARKAAKKAASLPNFHSSYLADDTTGERGKASRKGGFERRCAENLKEAVGIGDERRCCDTGKEEEEEARVGGVV